jgi:hypothetical protein
VPAIDWQDFEDLKYVTDLGIGAMPGALAREWVMTEIGWVTMLAFASAIATV